MADLRGQLSGVASLGNVVEDATPKHHRTDRQISYEETSHSVGITILCFVAAVPDQMLVINHNFACR